MNKERKAAKTKRLNKIILIVATTIILPYAVYDGFLLHKVSSVKGHLAVDGLLYDRIIGQSDRTRPRGVGTIAKGHVSFTASFIGANEISNPPKTTLRSIYRIVKMRMGTFTSPDPNAYMLTVIGLSDRKNDEFTLLNRRVKTCRYTRDSGTVYYDAYPEHWVSVLRTEYTPRDDSMLHDGKWIGPPSGKILQADWVSVVPMPDYQIDYFSEGIWKASYVYYHSLIIDNYLKVNVLNNGQSQFEGAIKQYVGK